MLEIDILQGEIKEHIKKNEYIDATNKLKEFIYQYKDDPWGYRTWSFLEIKLRKNYINAATIAEEGLEHFPNNFMIQQNLAIALSYIPGEENRVEKLFKELIRGKCTSLQMTKIGIAYADYLVRNRRHREATRIYELILRNDPEDNVARFDLARAYRISGDFEKCLEVLEQHPQKNDPYWHREMAHCLIDLGRADDASENLSAARVLADEWPKFKIKNIYAGFIKHIDGLCVAANALNGQWKEAADFIFKQKDKECYPVIINSVKKFINNNNKQEIAIEYFLDKFKEQKESLLIVDLIDFVLSKIDPKNSQIEKIIDELMVINDNNISVLLIYARYNKNSDYEKSLDILFRAIDLANDSQKRFGFGTAVSNITVLCSSILRQANRCEEAINVIEGSKVKFNLSYWEINFEKAISLIILGNLSDAHEILRVLYKSKRNNPFVLDQYAICLRLMGKYEEALNVYEEKVKVFEGDIQGWYGLAKTLVDLNRNNEAKKVLEKILSENKNDVESKILLAQIFKQEQKFQEAQEVLNGIDSIYILQDENCNLKIQRKLVELEKQKERQQIELEDAKKLAYLGTMATAVAHEINQPVGVIRAAASCALEDIKDGLFSLEEMKPLLENIWSQTERLHSIIDNFRRFARGDRAHREKIDINQVVKHVHSMFEEQFKIRGIVLNTQYWMKSSKPVIAWANFFQLEEVLINLITNARDAVGSSETPTVWLKVWRRRDGSASFAVEDNGPGLSEGCRKNMFMPFYSTKSTEEGTGLGLYISRRIIDSLGGQLSYQERRNGNGASFVVNFPPIRG